jgi:phage minor structural protein
MLNTDSLFNYVKEENIVVANANDTLLNQKFRIYMTRKLMNNKVEVFARHISFDLMYDYIDNISFTNQSCQYALNQLFINSNFSKHYKGYSDIVNAQNYKMSMANILEAIGGKSGSILDTFGNGAELLRDNENIHILNKRGHDNEVTIEYRKNLTGFELEEDITDLVTRIIPYAKYNDAETSEEITIRADYINSPLINNYSHPYIKAIDYSEKFEDGEIPTVEKLVSYAKREFNINKVDIPKQNFKIDFIPLSLAASRQDVYVFFKRLLSPFVPSLYLQSSAPSYIAVFGHSGSQAPQLMHSSVIIIAISCLILSLKIPKQKYDNPKDEYSNNFCLKLIKSLFLCKITIKTFHKQTL